jgi:hypothetical protein
VSKKSVETVEGREQSILQPAKCESETAQEDGKETGVKSVQPTVEKPVNHRLRPLRLVNKVLSEGKPVANLVPARRKIEVEQRITENETTRERLVVVEMKV